MPRIFGLNAVGVLISAIVFYMVGFVFYGVIFHSTWVELWNFTEAETAAMGENASLSMAMGFVISIFSAVFIGLALKMFGATDLNSALRKAIFLWAGFALPTLAYDSVYAGQSMTLLAIDAAHLLVSFTAVAAVQTLMDGLGVKSTDT
jgi:hypothetical protein